MGGIAQILGGRTEDAETDPSNESGLRGLLGGVNTLLRKVMDGQLASDAIRIATSSPISTQLTPETDRTSTSGLTTASSYNYLPFSPSGGWQIRALTLYVSETGGSNSADVRVLGTNSDSPTDPNTSTDDWFPILEKETVPAGGELQFQETTDVEEVAIGFKNGSGPATLDAELEVSSQATVAEIVDYIRSILAGEAAGDRIRMELVQESLGSDIDVDDSTLGDETAASQSADSTTAATVLERLTALVDALVSGQASDALLTRRDEDAGSAQSATLSDGATLSVDLNCENREKIIYTSTSDGDFSVDVTHFSAIGQSGDSVTQDASGGTVAGGNADGQDVRSSGKSATVELTDETSDASDATATLLAKAV